MRTTGWTCRFCAALATAVLACPISFAATSKAAKVPEAKSLEFEKIERVKNGKFAYVVGSTKVDAVRYVASNLLVTQPVVVTLKADNPKDKIRLMVTKTEWTKAEREGSTGADGRVRLSFRTQGDFGVAVSSTSAGKPYRMSVWIGDEVKSPMPPVVVPKSAWKPVAAVKNKEQ
jgi:hypothetical protein